MSTINDNQADAWDRWIIGVHVLFYGLLLYCSSAAWRLATPSQQIIVATVGCGLSLWYGLFIWRPMDYWETKQPWLALVFALGLALWLVVYCDFGIYGLMPFALFPLLYFYMSPPWSVFGTVILAVLAWAAGGIGGPSAAELLAGFLMVMVVLSFYVRSVTDQSFERKLLILELEKTRASLVRAERQTGILQERQRLSREIHDTLAQGFISVVMHLESAASVLPTDQEQAQVHITQATRTARVSLNEARRFIRELRPQVFDKGSLPQILPDIISDWAEATGVEAHLEITGTLYELPAPVQNVILRITQEALHNIQKHANAKNAFVTLTFTPNIFLVDIVDDGVGFDVSNQTFGHYGIMGMRERAASIDAQLTVESEPDLGTTLTIELPMDS